MPPDPARAQECRHETRHHLAVRSALALDANAVRRGLRGQGYTLAEVEAALRFLVDLGQVRAERDPLGSALYYQITAAGQLAEERGE